MESISEVRLMLQDLKVKVNEREQELLEEISYLRRVYLEMIISRQALIDQATSSSVNCITATDVVVPTKWKRRGKAAQPPETASLKLGSNKIKLMASDSAPSKVGKARALKKNLSRANPANQNLLQRQDRINPKEVEALKQQIKAKINSIENEMMSKSPDNTGSSGSATYTTAELQDLLESLNNLPHIIY